MKRRWMGLLVGALWPLSGCAQPDAHVVVAVKDEDGNAVTNVEVGVGTFVRRIPGTEAGFAETAQVEARTDTNGFASLTIPSRRGDLYIGMQPTEGFYYDRGIELRMTNAVGGRWEPWGQTNVLVVRRIVNPIPMYVKRILGGELWFPAIGTPLGFDLEVGDWLPPHGVGKVADFIFTLHRELGDWTTSGVRAYQARLDLTFSNPQDGFQEVIVPISAPPRGSVFRMPRFAPTEGYVSNMVWMKTRSATGATGRPNENQSFFFRVRSKQSSDDGAIIAHYGKIQGPINFGVHDQGACLMLTYYFNPTPGDRNMEFDPKQNLLKSASGWRVDDP